MLILLIGLVLFLGIHSVSIFAPNQRNALAKKNALLWKAIYSAISLLGLLLVISGYADARHSTSIIYATPYWLRHLSALLLLPVFILFFSPYFPGKIKRLAKHPQLLAVKLWAVSHLLVNGGLADIVLFGSFLIWAVCNWVSMTKRESRQVPSLPQKSVNDILVVALGLVAYVIFALHLHQVLIGVPPFA